MPKEIFASKSISITELKRQSATIGELVKDEPIVVLNRNTPAFYCVSPELFEQMINALEDAELGEIAEKRKDQKRIRVNIKNLD